MGRSMNWYVIPKETLHDNTKHFCFNWEFQPDEEDVDEEVYYRAISSDKVDDVNENEDRKNDLVSYFKKKKQEQEKRSKVLYENMYNTDNDLKSKWCPKCFMFAEGLHSSELLVAEEDVNHSYGNPIWDSLWNIKDLWIGSSDTPFVRKFRNDTMYREITREDVSIALGTINDLGEPMRNSDKQACEETLHILNFLKKWTDKDDTIVILEDEC